MAVVLGVAVRGDGDAYLRAASRETLALAAAAVNESNDPEPVLATMAALGLSPMCDALLRAHHATLRALETDSPVDQAQRESFAERLLVARAIHAGMQLKARA